MTTIRARWRVADDEGTTLMELVVAMTVMLIFLGIFTSSIFVIYKSQAKTTSISESADNINQAFLWLDKNVRYASAITTPGTSTGTGDWYVELRNTTSGTEKCTQVRLDITNAQLQYRTWLPSGGTATSLTTWTPEGSNLTNGSAASGSNDQPFYSVSNAVGSERYQSLRVTLASVSGTTTSRSQFTFVAINSTLPKSTSPVCQEAGRP